MKLSFHRNIKTHSDVIAKTLVGENIQKIWSYLTSKSSNLKT